MRTRTARFVASGGCHARQCCAEGFPGIEAMGRHWSKDPGSGLTTPKARRDAVLKAMRGHDISQRRACALIGVDPKTVRRKRPPGDPESRKAMQEVAALRHRPRLSAHRTAAGAQGHAGEPQDAASALPRGRLVGPAQAGPQAGPWHAQADAPGPDALPPLVAGLRGGHLWRLAQVRSPGCLNPWRTRPALAGIDGCCRKNPCLVAGTSISGARVARELEAPVSIHGRPANVSP